MKILLLFTGILCTLFFVGIAHSQNGMENNSLGEGDSNDIYGMKHLRPLGNISEDEKRGNYKGDICTYGKDVSGENASSDNYYVPGGWQGDERGLSANNVENVEDLRAENRRRKLREM